MHPMGSVTVGLGLLVAASAAAEEPPGVGSWAGTLGGSQVQVCFDRYGGAEMYDLGSWRPRRFVAVDSTSEDALLDGLARGELELWEVEGPRFEPAPPRGRWSLRLQEDVWQGEWREASGGPGLPVTLRRLPRAVEAGPECDAEFYRPIAEAVVIRRERASFAGQAYETWSTADAVAMAPLNGAPGAAALQAAAEAWLRERAVFAFQCRAGRGSVGEALGATLEPVLWTPRWLVLRDGLPETYCGGAHGSFSTAYQVWDLPHGAQIDGWSWIAGGESALRGVDDAESASPLHQALVRHHPRNQPDDDCAVVIGQMSVAAPYPLPEGLQFPTSFFHAMRACGEEVLIPWREAEPFLTGAGRALAREFGGAARR